MAVLVFIAAKHDYLPQIQTSLNKDAHMHIHDNDNKISIRDHDIACRAGSVRADFRVVTEVSYTSKEVENHVVALAKVGSLRGLVDPASVKVNGA